MIKILRYCLINGLFAAAVYFGVIVGIEGVQNIVKFITWASFIMALLIWAAVNADSVILTKMKGKSVPLWVDSTFDIGITLVLVYAGWIGYAVLYLIHSIIMHSIMHNVDIAKANATEAEAQEYKGN